MGSYHGEAGLRPFRILKAFYKSHPGLNLIYKYYPHTKENLSLLNLSWDYKIDILNDIRQKNSILNKGDEYIKKFIIVFDSFFTFLKSEGITIISSKSGFDPHQNIKLIALLSTSQALTFRI